MLRFDDFKSHITENQSNKSPLINISKDEFERLLNDEVVSFSTKTLKHGRNIFTYQLIQLAQGMEVNMPDYNYRAKLEEMDFKELLEMLMESPLNKKFSIFYGFIVTHPYKNVLLDTLSDVVGRHIDLSVLENNEVNILSINDMEELLNDKDNEKILYDLIKLAQGFVVNINGIKTKLEDVDFKTIRNMIRNSPLNDEYGSMFTLFMSTHPLNQQ
jgi:hypothetical protein